MRRLATATRRLDPSRPRILGTRPMRLEKFCYQFVADKFIVPQLIVA